MESAEIEFLIYLLKIAPKLLYRVTWMGGSGVDGPKHDTYTWFSWEQALEPTFILIYLCLGMGSFKTRYNGLKMDTFPNSAKFDPKNPPKIGGWF